MFIPAKNYLEEGMETTFSDLKAKHLQLVDAQKKLRLSLQEKAAILLNEYSESLSLPAGNWFNSQDKPRPYVEMGIWNADGKFEASAFSRLQLDEKYRLNFVIATTLDDTRLTGGYRHGVDISLGYDGAILDAIIGTSDDSTVVLVSQSLSGFSEVCATIKALISLDIDKAMPNAIIS
ncbi:hypothetical protein BED35_07505 [Yersinia enterocolitica]|uniref:hypothetical protein n=1 Tax=Yersinia enterocolitica TaxID=630 RepID=UPI00065A89C5|nr:hypothetical protein [Yersinia enterocolitica]AOF18343.1 hypothetical protein BED34_06680 [Yersinia enterocolitica]AOF18410.1 hypothetical protein BED34_07055 [Yersinia enterocolitica]AOF22874.1 hypothetical protein BED33_09340 [Yersinia enterocolitica]AOF22941.1 hypothetical protein BED33_09715 [Yersinia enterocolitica]AOF26584.1 hypothetical protein BED32_06655 [Yersinia enterocolitica]